TGGSAGWCARRGAPATLSAAAGRRAATVPATAVASRSLLRHVRDCYHKSWHRPAVKILSRHARPLRKHRPRRLAGPVLIGLSCLLAASAASAREPAKAAVVAPARPVLDLPFEKVALENGLTLILHHDAS